MRGLYVLFPFARVMRVPGLLCVGWYCTGCGRASEPAWPLLALYFDLTPPVPVPASCVWWCAGLLLRSARSTLGRSSTVRACVWAAAPIAAYGRREPPLVDPHTPARMTMQVRTTATRTMCSGGTRWTSSVWTPTTHWRPRTRTPVRARYPYLCVLISPTTRARQPHPNNRLRAWSVTMMRFHSCAGPHLCLGPHCFLAGRPELQNGQERGVRGDWVLRQQW